MTRFFEAEAMSIFRYYCYLPGWDPLENLNQNWTSPKWGETKTVKPSLVWIHLYYYCYNLNTLACYHSFTFCSVVLSKCYHSFTFCSVILLCCLLCLEIIKSQLVGIDSHLVSLLSFLPISFYFLLTSSPILLLARTSLLKLK